MHQCKFVLWKMDEGEMCPTSHSVIIPSIDDDDALMDFIANELEEELFTNRVDFDLYEVGNNERGLCYELRKED